MKSGKVERNPGGLAVVQCRAVREGLSDGEKLGQVDACGYGCEGRGSIGAKALASAMALRWEGMW